MPIHPFDILTLENNAQLIFTPCPGTKEATLSDSVSTLKAAGVDMIITLMFDQEMAENNALSLSLECQHNNIEWLQLPILDDAVPDHVFEQKWQAEKTKILDLINKQGRIAVHCKGGSGRTGLVIALILLAYGWPADKVIAEVQKVRPKALKHPLQLAYFNRYV